MDSGRAAGGRPRLHARLEFCSVLLHLHHDLDAAHLGEQVGVAAVGARAADDGVLGAVVAEEHVVARQAQEQVRAVAAVDDVVAGCPFEVVVAVPAVELVVAEAAEERIVPRAAAEVTRPRSRVSL